MSPTIFRESGFRFYFFSREEKRMHVHVQCAEGEAKYWLEPAVEAGAELRFERAAASLRQSSYRGARRLPQKRLGKTLRTAFG
jgi:hypothetical protein